MSIHHKESGSGEPLVLIHGLFGTLENLGGIARYLAQNYTVYSLDLPNHGRSAHTNRTDLSSVTSSIREWMLAQGLARAHIFGHSLGGKVAMELALTYPEFVDKLIVADISPVHYDPHHNQVFDGLLSLQLSELRSRADADKQLAAYVDESAVRSFLLKNLVKLAEGGFSWRMNLPVIHEGYPSLVAENANNATFDGSTLFLKGGASDYIQEAHREAILTRFPQAGVKIVANTGHWLHAEKPEIVAKLVDKFLSALPKES